MRTVIEVSGVLRSRPPVGVAAVAAGVALAVLGWVNLFVYTPEVITSRVDAVYELLINGGLAVASVVLMYETLDSELEDDDVRVAGRWFFVPILFLWALVMWANVDNLLSGASPLEYSRQLLVYGGLSALGGVVIGRNRARARQNHRLLRETEHQRRQISEQHNTLEFINRLLRHDVANGLTVISARSEMLTDHEDEMVREHARVVFDRSAQLGELTERVREFSAALQGTPDPLPVEVTDIVHDEVRRIRRTYPDVDFSVDAPESARALAGQFLVSALANVLENAIEHNDADRPSVAVAVESTDDEVRIRVADNGPGIDDERKADIVQPPDATTEPVHGVGLSLVETVLDRYGGGLDISDNDPRGTVVALRLRRADDESPSNPQRQSANA
ncbi:histidine kinase [Halogeometricum pallidum JCM 14848]|uniref:histidine kinase n=1 Tax=Halogeometricum pallidum JCM 14848 TaxID=1227487 RepID=M0DG58_HALPD|nr:HAMP domain-containing sensor histidine kinase [Halogeometricum pallidum]ELZ34445.1 histidine kinase [Halogeometricum pallidum JCM 14848]